MIGSKNFPFPGIYLFIYIAFFLKKVINIYLNLILSQATTSKNVHSSLVKWNSCYISLCNLLFKLTLILVYIHAQF